MTLLYDAYRRYNPARDVVRRLARTARGRWDFRTSG